MTSSRHFSTLEFHDARSSHPAHDDDPDDANLHRGATRVFTHRVFFLAWRRLHPARGTHGVHQRGDRGEQEKGGCQDGERDELPARGSAAAVPSDDGTGDVWVCRERGTYELKSGLCRIFLVARRRRNLRQGSSRARRYVSQLENANARGYQEILRNIYTDKAVFFAFTGVEVGKGINFTF